MLRSTGRLLYHIKLFDIPGIRMHMSWSYVSTTIYYTSYFIRWSPTRLTYGYLAMYIECSRVFVTRKTTTKKYLSGVYGIVKNNNTYQM